MNSYKITLAFYGTRRDAEYLYDLICDGLPRSIGVNLLPRQSETEQNVIVFTFMMEQEAAEKFLRANYQNMRQFDCAFDLKLVGNGTERQENFHPCVGFNLDTIISKPSDEEV
jgi:hypothetical protein